MKYWKWDTLWKWDIGYWILDIGSGILDIGYWILDIGSGILTSTLIMYG
jgi:hypothetical protein